MVVVTWNAQLEVFARVEVVFGRDAGGAIEASTSVEVLPDYRINRPDVAFGVAGQAFKMLMVLGRGPSSASPFLLSTLAVHCLRTLTLYSH